MFVDMQKANVIGRSLDQLLQDGIRLAYDKHMDANVYVGLSDYGTTGLVNNTDATETTVTNGAAGKATWVTKTPQEILGDINTAITATWAAAEYDTQAMPNHILIPYEQYPSRPTSCNYFKARSSKFENWRNICSSKIGDG